MRELSVPIIDFLRHLCRRLIACASAAAVVLSAHAGGSAETTLLVVNGHSPLSLSVANEYIRLRDLPERQVLWLDDVPPLDTIDVDTFRSRILAPVRAHLQATGLEQEIDLIAYSAGFPYAVDFRSDERAHGLERDKYRGGAGSLTGMTYFSRQVEAGTVTYLGLRTNHYFRRPLPSQAARVSPRVLVQQDGGAMAASEVIVPFEAARAFRSRYLWGRGPGSAGMAETDRYVLAAMLGYTGFRGNSLPEIRAYLARAAASDGTHPEGTVYLMENRNIRGKVRRPMFGWTIAALEARGRRVEVLTQGRDGQNGREPRGKTDIVGLAAGTRVLKWATAGSQLLPGAIAESFTSYAGHFAHPSQTKLTEFLRQGAAGSSGAVREPYSFVEKFPVPHLHVHYADGASLAEAYYQSVASPYQLLVVGDPLTRPFAHFGKLSLRSPDPGLPWRGVVDVVADVVPPAGQGVERVELWVNGQVLDTVPPGQELRLDTRVLADGINELRLVAVEASAIETRSYGRWPIRVDNQGRQVTLDRTPQRVGLGEMVALAGVADGGAQRVEVRQASRRLGEADVRDGRWSLRFPAATLGVGPVRLQVVAAYPDGGLARAAPFELEVTTPALVPAGAAPQPDREGVKMRLQRRAGAEVEEAVVPGVDGRMPREFRSAEAHAIAYAGAFEVRGSGLYEMSVEAVGDVTLAIDGWGRHHAVVAAEDGGFRIALPLAKGWHAFSLEVSQAGSARVRAVLAGPEVAFELAGERVRW